VTGLGAQSAFSGRKRWEDHQPQAAAVLRQLAEAQAQQDPTFRPPLASTRLTATAAGAALRAQGVDAQPVPAPSPRATVLKRPGFGLRKVLTANPPKKLAHTDAIFATSKKKTRTRRPPAPSNA